MKKINIDQISSGEITGCGPIAWLRISLGRFDSCVSALYSISAFGFTIAFKSEN
jgi:hypothetical protein